jgi:hypothetical protein
VYEISLEKSAVANMPDARNQFVLIKARKSRGAHYWDKDDYDVRDSYGKLSGASCITRKHRKICRGFGREQLVKSHHQLTIAGIQRHANRRWQISRRDGWRVSTNLCPLFDDLLNLPTVCGLGCVRC